MWRKLLFFFGALALTAAGIATVAYYLKAPEQLGAGATDPRTTPLLVKVVNATQRIRGRTCLHRHNRSAGAE